MRAGLLIRQALQRFAVAAALASAVASGGALADERGRPIQDPHYGDTLFHFYQERYFTAVTNLMVSQHFDRVPQHRDEAEVLRGGMLLSYGLHREAGEIFAQLIEKGATPAVRDRAWFYLAKIRYQRGLHAEGEQALAHVGHRLPPVLEEERGLLHAQLLMARADYAAAAKVLSAMTGSSDAGFYARYNLGVALVRNGDSAHGSDWLDSVGRASYANEELRGLRDKANVALGFAALQDERPDAARTYLQRVRLSGLHANKALLGFGWAAAALEQPKQALVPWTELAQRELSDAAALEARIAVPYAYAELGAFGQALDRYNEAIEVFDRESASVDESIAAIRSGKLVEALIDRNPGDEMGWFWNLRELPEMPHARHLAQVLAQHEFQEAFKNYRDLRFLANNLQRWQDSLGVFGDMLANRRQAYAQRLPQVRAGASSGVGELERLQKRRADLAGELARAEADADGYAFADDRQRGLLSRLASVQATLKQHAADSDVAGLQDRIRLAAGAMTWDLAQDYSARAWEARKALGAIDAELSAAQRRDAAIALAQRDEPARFERFGGRIAGLDQRIRVLIPRVAALGREQQQAVQDIAVAELTRHKERLAVYTTQARFAVAQLYDRAHLARQADHARKQ